MKNEKKERKGRWKKEKKIVMFLVKINNENRGKLKKNNVLFLVEINNENRWKVKKKKIDEKWNKKIKAKIWIEKDKKNKLIEKRE